MANLGYKKNVFTGDEYINLETELGVSLTEGGNYNIQIQGDGVSGVMLCEATSKPTDGGFFWKSDEPFPYKKESDTLWIKVQDNKKVYINIAEA